jgi:cell division septal protein FtsQ
MAKKSANKNSLKNVKKQTKKNSKKQISQKQNYKTVKVKRKRIRFKRVLLALFLLGIVFYFLLKLLSFPIKSIYVTGNSILSEQEIIELASLENYPSYFSFSSFMLEKKLENNIYILSCKIKKKHFREVVIEVEENEPILYDSTFEKTILKDGSQVDDTFIVPTLLNYVPDTIYDKFIENLASIDKDIYHTISEITYDPNDVDSERFLFYMDDGNSVYVTLKTITSMNNYIDIMKEVKAKYENQNGILFLDEGEYFEVYSD